MIKTLGKSIGVLLLTATLSAWIQDAIPDWLCEVDGTCSDFDGAVNNQCGNPIACKYDVDNDGVIDCFPCCTRCDNPPQWNFTVWDCKRFEELECVPVAGVACPGFLSWAPCMGAGCTPLWNLTTDNCWFPVPDCVH